MQNLLKTLDGFSGIRVLVAGDLLLDQFLFGEISRVSREAPVLILRYQNTHAAPGGCANTVANVESLGAEVIPVGFLGDDESGHELLSLLPKNIDKQYIFCDSEFQTTRKKRILAGSSHSFQQQVVRVDHEYPCLLKKHHKKKIIDALQELIPQVDAVILSDYSLGNLPGTVRKTAMEVAAQHDKFIVADSRDHPHFYQGATSITPNIKEIEGALSISATQSVKPFEKAANQLRKDWNLKALLVTRGSLGMSLFEKNKFTHIPVFGTDEIADVTGAGDTVTATYTTALAAGCTFQEAAHLANYAGGIVVMKKGTATISCGELREALLSNL